MSQSTSCFMCEKILRVKLLGNHLMNQHNVSATQVGTVARMHLNKKIKKVVKKQSASKKLKIKNCHKKPMERSSLKKRFEDAIQEQYFSMDVFSKLLMDVSRDYHSSKINRGIEDEQIEKTFNDASILNESNAEYRGDLRFKINVSSQKVEKVEGLDTSKLLDESLIQKGLLITNLNESCFLPGQNSTMMNESMTKQTNVSKLKTSRAMKLKTSTPKPKKTVARKIKK